VGSGPLVAQVSNLCVFHVCRGLGAAHARRRTLTSALQAFARSMLPPLRHRGCASEATPSLGHGQPLAALPVAQVSNPCVFAVRRALGFSRSTGCQPVCVLGSHHPSHVIPEGGAAGSEARAEAGATCAPPGCAEAIEQRTHTPQVGRRPHSRRRRACRRPAAGQYELARARRSPASPRSLTPRGGEGTTQARASASPRDFRGWAERPPGAAPAGTRP